MLVSKRWTGTKIWAKFWETDSHNQKHLHTIRYVLPQPFFYVFEATISGTETRLIHRGRVHGKPDGLNISRLSLLHVIVVLHDLLIFEGNAFLFPDQRIHPEEDLPKYSRLSSLHAEHLKDLSSKIEECHSLVQICSWTPVQSPPARWSPHVIKVPSCRRAAKAFPAVELFNAEPSESTDWLWNL